MFTRIIDGVRSLALLFIVLAAVAIPSACASAVRRQTDTGVSAQADHDAGSGVLDSDAGANHTDADPNASAEVLDPDVGTNHVDGAGGCDPRSCGFGEFCMHTYYTHSPGWEADAGACPPSYPLYLRGYCWARGDDRCEPLPAGCSGTVSCGCAMHAVCDYWFPPLPACTLENDGTMDCWAVGI